LVGHDGNSTAHKKELDKNGKTVNIRATGWELAQRLQNEPAEI